MEKLGLKTQPGSGNQWLNKEDGEDEFLLAQLKSTDADSYRLDRLDLDKLEYHAMVNHKVPVFLTQFLSDGQIYLTINIKNLEAMILYWQEGNRFNMDRFWPSDDLLQIGQEEPPDITDSSNKRIVKSGNKQKYYREREKEYEKRYKKKKIGKRK